jgi:TOD1/MUCI70, glycosyltransferase-like domain
MSVALVTSIYGDYDELVDPPKQIGVDEYVAIVDREYPSSSLWRQVIEPRPHMHPRLAAKVAKCLPWRYTDADVSVWVDGGARLKHEGVAEWAAEFAPFAQFEHPERDDVTAEAEVSAGIEKYQHQPVLAQVAHYREQGMPQGFGLWATGMIVRERPSQARGRQVSFGRDWLTEQMVWSYQDQLSEPYLFWRAHFKPNVLDGNLWNNPHIAFTGHRSSA